MKDEPINIQTITSDDAAQSVVRPRKKDLPKFKLGKGDDFYITLPQLSALNERYYKLLSDMQDAESVINPPELRSFMESVVYESYIAEISRMQRNNKLDGDIERERVESLNMLLSPHRWRSWYCLWRKKRNTSAVLLDELVMRQTQIFYAEKERNLPEIEAHNLPYTEILERLKELIPRRMKNSKRAAWDELIEQLTLNFEIRANEIRRLQDEQNELQNRLNDADKKETVRRMIAVLSAYAQKKSSEKAEPEQIETQQTQDTDDTEFDDGDDWEYPDDEDDES